MKTGRRSTGTGLALALLAAFGAAASCRDIVSGDSIDAVAELCGTLEACYGDAYDCGELTQKASQSSGDAQAELTSFLDEFGTRTCSLDSCSGSLSCLDHPLFCGDGGAACEVDQDCCKWSEGLGACRAEPDSGGAKCCGADGARCTETSDCCASECIDQRCGGVVCKFVEDSCRWGAECCSGRCEGPEGQRVCVEKVCSDVGQPCKDAGECCQDPAVQGEIGCYLGDGGQQICRVPAECAQFGEACDPNGASSCCDGFACATPVGTGVPVCASIDPTECKPLGFDCASDGDCCEDAICVLAVGQSFCQPPIDGCGKAGTDCMGGEQCCSQICTNGACVQATSSTCDNLAGLCHSPLLVGSVITADCPESDACVESVNQGSDFCRCTAWDLLCVEQYSECVAQ